MPCLHLNRTNFIFPWNIRRVKFILFKFRHDIITKERFVWKTTPVKSVLSCKSKKRISLGGTLMKLNRFKSHKISSQRVLFMLFQLWTLLLEVIFQTNTLKHCLLHFRLWILLFASTYGASNKIYSSIFLEPCTYIISWFTPPAVSPMAVQQKWLTRCSITHGCLHLFNFQADDRF